MKLLLIGDIHIKRKDFSRSKSLAEQIIEQAKANPSDAIIFLGDVLDAADIIHAECLHLLSSLLFSLAEDNKIFVLMGNHDASTPHVPLPEVHALSPFKNHKNITIIDKPCSHLGFFFMPYLPPGKFFEHLPEEAFSSIVFAHQEFYGCAFSGNLFSEHGDKIPDSFSGKIISGHIHEEQTKEKLWYPGTPAQTRFGESKDKGIFLIDADQENYKILKKISLNIPNYIALPYEIGSCATPPDDYHIYKAIIKGTYSEIVAFRATDEKAHVDKAFSSRVKIIQTEKQTITKDNKKEKTSSFMEIFTEKAKQENLSNLLTEIL